jgi:hypothetical protein
VKGKDGKERENRGWLMLKNKAGEKIVKVRC